MARYGRSAQDVVTAIGHRAHALRLQQNLRQDELAGRAGIGVRTLKRFEKTGRATLENVARIAIALRAEAPLDGLFEAPRFASIDEAIAAPVTKRIRATRKRTSA